MTRPDAALALLQMLYGSAIGGMLLWTLGHMRDEPRPVLRQFAAYQGCNLLHALCSTGSMAALAPASWPGLMDRLASLSEIGLIFLGLTFLLGVMIDYPAPRWMTWLHRLLLPAMALTMAACLSGHEGQALLASHLLAPLLGLAYFGMTFLLQPGGPQRPDLRRLRLFYGANLLLALAPALALLDGNSAQEWMLHAERLQGLLGAALMVWMLALRSRLTQQHAQEKLERAARLERELELRQKHADEERQFIDMLAHDIKTPLSVALISVGALKTDSPYLERIRVALGHINNIVDRARLSELAEHGGLTPRPGRCDLFELACECAESSSAPERVKVLEGQPSGIMSDSHLLAIVLNNLIDNALKYAMPQSEVTVAFERDARRPSVHLCVRNAVRDGQAPDPRHVFAKYYRGPNAQGKNGSGLGLYLSRNIALLLGAELRCGVQDNHVEFRLCLPA